jgi:hypothetical protein
MRSDTSSSANSSSNGANAVDVSQHWLDLYKEICTNIRTTDDISFKLLGFVPVFAGSAAGALTLLEKAQFPNGEAPYVVLALSIVGLVITFGLFRWEMRNVQRCKWLIKRAVDVELYMLGASQDPLRRIQFQGWEDAPREPINWKWPWGKTASESLVYSAAMLAWFIPILLATISLSRAFLSKH